VRSSVSGFLKMGEGEREDGESFKGRTLFDFWFPLTSEFFRLFLLLTFAFVFFFIRLT